MTVPPDLDKGGGNVQRSRIYQGPSLGWVDALIEDTTPPAQPTILFREAYKDWAPIILGGNLTFNNGVLNATGAGLPDAPADGQTYGRNNGTWTVVSGGGGGGGGNVSSSGTPVNGQVAVWLGPTTIQGVPVSSLGLAPILSPTFTGSPQAPTPPAADNSTSIATTAYVTTGINNLSGTINGQLALKANLISPSFTGTPTAPTPATTDNSTNIATTAFVKNTLGNYQPLNVDLTALSGLTSTNVIYYRSGVGAWTPVSIGANLSFSGGVLSATGTGGGGTGSVNTSGSVTATMLTGYADSSGNLIRGITVGSGLTLTGTTLSATVTGGVSTLNGLSGALNISAGAAISVTPSGSTISIANTGCTGINGINGAVNLVAGANITLTPSGQNITIASTAAGGVTSVNTMSGAIVVAAGTGISVAASAGTVTVTNTQPVGGNVSNSGTPTAGQTAIWTDATHVQGHNIFTCSITAPTSPQMGDFWYDLNTGVLAAYVNDGNSLQWVQVSPGIPGPGNFIPRDATTNITAGYTVTSANLGTIVNYTVNPAIGNYQYGINNGGVNINAASNDCAVDILITNGASAAAITFNGFTVGSNTGDSYTLTSGQKFIISTRRINAISTYTIKALQ